MQTVRPNSGETTGFSNLVDDFRESNVARDALENFIFCPSVLGLVSNTVLKKKKT